MSIKVREFDKDGIKFMIQIWNEVVKDGTAFPQTELLDESGGFEFFSSQSFVGVAVEADANLNKKGELYILHPNNVGRCAHIANASYAVAKNARGKGVGEILVHHSLRKARELGFRIMQFNAVVANNEVALRLYEKLGFTKLGVIKGGFLNKNGIYEDIIPHYIELI